MKKILLALLAILALMPEAQAQVVEQDVSSVYVGGHFRRNRPTTVTTLRNSGFTTVILFNVHVDTDGTLMTDGETICKDGVYVFGNTQPNYINDVKKLKVEPTSVERIEICIGGWGNDSYDHIKDLINADGTGEETILYKNFKALKEAIPEIDAVNNDQEQCYDITTARQFHKMMGDLGYTTTIAPYTRKDYWQQLATYLKRNKLLDRILIQCYDGGAGNNPSDWQLVSGVPVHAGRMYYQDTWDVNYHIDKFADWQKNNGVTGGFVWVYNDETWNLNAWATGINRVYKARSVSDDLVGVKVYSENNYGGYCVAFPEGTYKLADMAVWGVANKDISSFELAEGYTVTFYFNNICGGKGYNFTESSSELASNYNKKFASMKVERVEATGIQSIEDKPLTESTYDLQGRRISQDNLKKGIYIINGKKVIK